MNAQQRSGREPYTIAIVGAGPRGTSVLERLASELRRTKNHSRPITVVVFDLDDPGAGHVWSTTQSRLYLMNTPAGFPTVAPERTGADEPGLSFEQWRLSGGDGAALSSVEARELKEMGRGSYPPRALYGRYLRHVFDRSIAALRAHEAVAGVRVERAEITSLNRGEADYQLRGRRLGAAVAGKGRDGEEFEMNADAVILALGHVPARLNPKQDAMAQAALDMGLTYQGPNVPTDVAWDRVPPGQTVLVRGLGLNFFDVMVALTVGRGGQFKEVNGGPGRALEYWPSGRESRIVAASRRGTPYRAKSCIEEFIPKSVKLQYLDFDVIVQKVAEARLLDPEATVRFDAHVWPLLHRDVLLAYYSTAASRHRSRFNIDPEAFVKELGTILDAEHQAGSQVWLQGARRLVAEHAPELGFLDVPGLGHPFLERGFSSSKEYQQAVMEYLESDAIASADGEKSPLKMAIATLNAGRMVVKEMIAEGLISDESRLDEVQGWFEPLVEGLASGPPVQRIEELAALARANVVEFIGPDPEFGIDLPAGRFTAASPWVDAPGYTSRTLIEAMMPANRVLQSSSPLLVQMLADGVAAPFKMRTDEGEPLPGSGLAVKGEPYRLVDALGVAHRAIFVIGLQLSSVQWGTAIAAQAGASLEGSARTLGDARDIARELLRLSQVQELNQPR